MRLLSVSRAPVATRTARSPLVGREDELALLSHLCRRAVESRRCQLITILGDPGVGKTRLAEELVTRMGEQVRVLRGRCLPYGDGITFYPVAEAFGQAAGLDPGMDTDVATAKLAELIGPKTTGSPAPWPKRSVSGARSTAPDETLWAIRRSFEMLAARKPLLLLFDDLQWAEPTFLELLDAMAQRSRGVGLVLLCTARPELLERRPEWGGGTMNAVATLLEPLTSSDSLALAGRLLDGALDPGVASRLADAGGGNPLFLEEYVSMLLEDGSLHRDDDRWTLSGRSRERPDPTDVGGPPRGSHRPSAGRRTHGAAACLRRGQGLLYG